GVVKILNAFVKASAAAVADQRELSTINAVGWVSVVIGIAGAVVGARWGLAGVIYGVAVGWLVRALVPIWITARHLREPAVPAVQPAGAP
ncbi:MAG TPA: hypothetical protein VMN37_01690, partial [Gemmatimonadales bacterium]|nr:hypothetical protein [Gemmatimonadales bacterium]